MTSAGTLMVSERRQALIDAVRTRGRLESAAAAAELGTSTETIRKDLIALESQGLLNRVHGGALALQSLTFEPDIGSRTENLAEKRRIAARALAEVPRDGAIFIDAGSTTQVFAEILIAAPGLLVFTNALTVAGILAGKHFLNCHTVGGRVRPNSLAEVGSLAQRVLDDFRFDVAFVGTNAASFSRGLCTPDPEEAAIKRAIIVNSERVLLLADHTKFGRNSLVKFADLDEIDLVITGTELEAEQRAALAEAGAEVELA
jgi:DeoR family fructose operon transcriptional repressor